MGTVLAVQALPPPARTEGVPKVPLEVQRKDLLAPPRCLRWCMGCQAPLLSVLGRTNSGRTDSVVLPLPRRPSTDWLGSLRHRDLELLAGAQRLDIEAARRREDSAMMIRGFPRPWWRVERRVRQESPKGLRQ